MYEDGTPQNNMTTHIGNNKCSRCHGTDSGCYVCHDTVEEPRPMKIRIEDEQIRIAMAEARGLFKEAPLRRTTQRGNESPVGSRLWYREHDAWLPIPDYPNDLNDVHRFEEWVYDNVMDSDQWETYGKLLEKSHPQANLLNGKKVDYHEFAHLCHISARRRCECLLVAMRKA